MDHDRRGAREKVFRVQHQKKLDRQGFDSNGSEC